MASESDPAASVPGGVADSTAPTTATATMASAATSSPSPAHIPQKRTLDEDHTPRPSVPSPLNPDVRPTPTSKTPNVDDMPSKRTKKETLKKREAKSGPAEGNRGPSDQKRKLDDDDATAPPSDSPLRYKLPPAKQGDFDPPRGPVFNYHHDVPTLDGQGKIEVCETTDHVFNKKSYRYTPCIADPAFPSSLFYRQSEHEPYGPHLGFEDAATDMFFDQTGQHVTTDKGFRMTRANVAIREGRFYWECRITRGIIRDRKEGDPESHGHVRLGFARREAAVDAPVGFDAYSYGIRDKQGQKVFMSRPKDLFPAGEQIYEGDVIGLEIQLPSEQLHRKVLAGNYNPAVDTSPGIEGPPAEAVTEAPNIVRDRIPIRFKSHIYFEQIDYHTTKELEDLMSPATGTTGSSSSEPPNPHHRVHALRTLPHSYIKVYKNGEPMGTAFEDLLAFLPPASRPLAQNGAREGFDDGMCGYYPAISVFRGGAAETNFGPDFWCPPPGLRCGSGSGSGEEDQNMSGVDKDGAAAAAPLAIRPVSDRYTEQIVEDVVHDLIDEVDFWMQDGAKVIDHSGSSGPKAGSAGMVNADEGDIREVVQDD